MIRSFSPPLFTRRVMLAWRLVAAVLLAIGGVAWDVPAVAETWVNADTSQFTSLSLNTPTAVNFLGTGDLTMTQTSTIGSPIVTNTWNGTFTTPVNGRPNPDWVLGTRSYFQLASPTTGTSSSTVSYELQFATALTATSQLVFIDFDSLEQVTIKAFDTTNTLIPFANTTILRSPGQDSSPAYAGISWAASGGATGLLANTDNNSESNIIASISSSTPIQRLVYEFNFSQVDSGGGTIRFQVASPEPVAIPEIDPTGIGSVLALVTGFLGLLEKRRRTTAD